MGLPQLARPARLTVLLVGLLAAAAPRVALCAPSAPATSAPAPSVPAAPTSATQGKQLPRALNFKGFISRFLRQPFIVESGASQPYLGEHER